MTPLITRIPTHVLLPLITLAVFMVIYLVEVVSYYWFNGWYYRTGPAILRERWQTTATAVEVRQLIGPIMKDKGYVGRESVHGFCFRQRGVSVNAWTRFLLRIEETQHGVALHYEVRPFYSIALQLVPFAWLTLGVLGISSDTIVPVGGIIATTLAIYKWITPWDIRRMNRLPSIRQALAPHGLLVCEQCGYDMFNHSAANRCPECGNKNPTP
jgi:hypothetical protein